MMEPPRTFVEWLAGLDFREVELRVLAQGQSRFTHRVPPTGRTHCECPFCEVERELKFVRAILLDSVLHPENLYDSEDVWDNEWTDLLRGVSAGE